jgi:hypothetical protein
VNRRLRRLRTRLQRLLLVEAGGRAARLLAARAAGVNPDVVLETWDAVADGMHNSNTDLTYFDGWFYLCHQTSPYHLGSRRSRMLLWRSREARAWEKVKEFRAPEWEYRDPTFAQINGRLFLYVLPNGSRMAEPNTTTFSWSDDGTTWSEMAEVDHPGWLYWRPKTRDGVTWYVTAYWHEHGKSVLLKTNDGMTWETVSQVHEGERNDETDCEFLPDGRMIVTARLEGKGDFWGDDSASTLIAVAEPPYTEWSKHKSRVTRLDGPCLFPYHGRVYAVGRYQASHAPRIAEQGGMWSKKRTSFFAVEEDRLIYLCDLPSAGDTSYAGVVQQGDDLYVSWYTSPPKLDWVWVTGMFEPTSIKMARCSLPALERLATAKGARAPVLEPAPA